MTDFMEAVIGGQSPPITASYTNVTAALSRSLLQVPRTTVMC